MLRGWLKGPCCGRGCATGAFFAAMGDVQAMWGSLLPITLTAVMRQTLQWLKNAVCAPYWYADLLLVCVWLLFALQPIVGWFTDGSCTFIQPA